MAPLENLRMLSEIKNFESNPVVLISEKQCFFIEKKKKKVTFLDIYPKQ